MNREPYIHAISYYLPEKKLTNTELSETFADWSEEKIFEKTGINERSISGENEFVTDMAYNAAKNLFNEYNIDPAKIGFLIICTQSPDYYLPTMACVLQERLKLPTSCGAVDINQGCSGFIYSLAFAKSLIYTGIADNVMLIMSETYSKHIHPLDKSTRTLFGDAAAAVLVKRGNDESNIGEFVLGSDGRGANNLVVPAGGMRLRRSEETGVPVKDKFGNTRSMDNLHMNGPEIFKFTSKTIPGLVEDIFVKNNIEHKHVQMYVFHQANAYMLENLRKILKIPSEKFYVNISNIGNTVSASIPIALKNAVGDGRIKKGDLVVIAGFGVGYSWGGTVIRW